MMLTVIWLPTTDGGAFTNTMGNSTVASLLGDGNLTDDELEQIKTLFDLSSPEGQAAIMGTFGSFDSDLATQYQDYLDSLETTDTTTTSDTTDTTDTTDITGTDTFVGDTYYYKRKGPDGQWRYRTGQGFGRSVGDIDITKEEYDAAMSGGGDDTTTTTTDTTTTDTTTDPFAGTALGTNAATSTDEDRNLLVDMIADGTTTTAEVAARYGLDEDAVIAEYTGIMDDRLATAALERDEALASGDITGVAGTNNSLATQEDINALVDGVVSGDFTAQDIADQYDVDVNDVLMKLKL